MRIFAFRTGNDAFDNHNPYSVIGANTIDANKVGESLPSAAIAASSHSFATTGVQQVAYAGSDKEFDLTLEMKDETVAHEAKWRRSSEIRWAGLFSADAAAIESTRAARNPMKRHRTTQARKHKTVPRKVLARRQR